MEDGHYIDVRRLALAVVIAAMPACAARQSPTELPPVTEAPVRPPSAGPATSVAAVGGAVPSAPSLPPEVVRVAGAYATAALSYRFDAGPSAWVDSVAPICTPSWLAELRSERTGPGDWAGVLERREVAMASVLAVHASASVGTIRRAVVALRIDVAGEAPSQRPSVVELDLVSSGGRWLVANSG